MSSLGVKITEALKNNPELEGKIKKAVEKELVEANVVKLGELDEKLGCVNVLWSTVCTA